MFLPSASSHRKTHGIKDMPWLHPAVGGYFGGLAPPPTRIGPPLQGFHLNFGISTQAVGQG